MYPNTSRQRIRLAAASIVAASLLAACGSSDQDEASDAAATVTTTVDAMADETATTDVMVDDAMAEDAMADETATTDVMVDEAMADETATTDVMVDEAMADETATTDVMVDEMVLPAWQTISLTDVDGASFTLDDFHGTPVFVETFATWCPNCKKQLEATNAAAEQLGDQAVFVALSVETNLSAADVAEYAADNGFDSVRFAVMTPEALAAFVDGLGQSAANPPSTPKVLIDPMGQAGELTTGFESADDIVAQVTGQG
jgi:thiol-disulfide isomerase/thioredoxin